MSVKLTCPRCDTLLNLGDHLRGKSVRCKVCEKVIAVPDAEPEDLEPIEDRTRHDPIPPIPRKRLAPARGDEDERPIRRRSRDDIEKPAGSNVGLIIGVGVAAFVVVLVAVGGLLTWVLFSSGPVPAPGGPPVAVGGAGGAGAMGVAPGPGGVAAAAGPTLRYRWQGTPAVYAVTVSVGNQNDFDVQMGHVTVTARPANAPRAPAGQKATGTGFVVNANGYLITCAHVVEGATKIDVAIGGRTHAGTVLAVDHANDIALVQIPANGLPTVPLADSDRSAQGSEVWAVGYPLSQALGDSIKTTKGILSGTVNQEGVKSFQVDAAINQGNSGGPLFDLSGGVLGVNKAKLTGEKVSNVGFATPINEAARMLRDKGVAYTAANPGVKLEGPALVAQVTPAVALITVTLGGGGGEAYTLAFANSLTPSKMPRQPGVDFAPPAGGPPVAFAGRRGEIDADAMGALLQAPRNDTQLPALLGGVGRFLLEPMPMGNTATWDRTNNWTISVTEGGGGPFGPRPFGPPRPIGPRFGPPGFPGMPGGARERQQPAVERSVYTRQAVNGDLITIDKRFELKADPLQDIAGFTFTGTKVIVFDTKNGLPRSMEFKGEIVETAGNVTLRVPVTASYKMLEGADRDRVLDAKAPAPVVPAPKAPAGPLSDAELTEALADVAGADRIKRSRAVGRLRDARPDEKRRAEVAKVLTGVVETEKQDGFHRRACLEALGVWGTADSVPTLLPLLDESDVFLRGAAIVALGKLKDERAAEPLARRLGVLQDRHAAGTALQSIGPKAEKAVAGQLNKLDLFGKLEALKILKEVATAESKAALEVAAKDSNPSVARQARDILAKLGRK